MSKNVKHLLMLFVLIFEAAVFAGDNEQIKEDDRAKGGRIALVPAALSARESRSSYPCFGPSSPEPVTPVYRATSPEPNNALVTPAYLAYLARMATKSPEADGQ